ncbi:ribonuclease P protein component [Candidatus Uhrbacteria bacterium RIFOXYC2_FULL_47_19]|uniref:Ribonuclease P protein component n=1 Tax=Candidatus Uhrbacteria bacterium RIFOXYC2_FULL_47_19 TaxID=1802424 RepID=A0A1F7WFL8_9BACT|nr:MAG: ribonuclease P protein component [Candidatus Uhrbacteria bacterium RIFOXYC2_FULL_47_19]HCC22490.1 ribonuclease P protein component [Candidatus Uhrbacteria bacterium]
MIPKDKRLISKKDFSRVFSKGRIFHGRGLSAKICRNSLEFSRFGLVISTKVSKKAVLRNKARRRLRSIVGRLLPSIKGNQDVAILARKEVLDMTFEQIETSTIHLLEKVGLLKSGDQP